MTKIAIRFESEGYYSEDELKDLREDLLKAAFDFDGEVMKETFVAEIVNEDAEKAEEAKARASAIDLLNAGAISVTVIVQDEDGEVLSEAKLSTDEG